MESAKKAALKSRGQKINHQDPKDLPEPTTVLASVQSNHSSPAAQDPEITPVTDSQDGDVSPAEPVLLTSLDAAPEDEGQQDPPGDEPQGSTVPLVVIEPAPTHIHYWTPRGAWKQSDSTVSTGSVCHHPAGDIVPENPWETSFSIPESLRKGRRRSRYKNWKCCRCNQNQFVSWTNFIALSILVSALLLCESFYVAFITELFQTRHWIPDRLYSVALLILQLMICFMSFFALTLALMNPDPRQRRTGLPLVATVFGCFCFILRIGVELMTLSARPEHYIPRETASTRT